MHPEMPLPLSFEEHRELGQEVKRTGARLRELAALIENVYGPQNQAAFTFQRLTEYMDRLTGDLQAQAAQDLPDRDARGLYR